MIFFGDLIRVFHKILQSSRLISWLPVNVLAGNFNNSRFILWWVYTEGLSLLVHTVSLKFHIVLCCNFQNKGKKWTHTFVIFLKLRTRLALLHRWWNEGFPWQSLRRLGIGKLISKVWWLYVFVKKTTNPALPRWRLSNMMFIVLFLAREAGTRFMFF